VKVIYKVWLDNNGKAFGEGPYELLKRVEQTQSLHQAANQMGMAYSKAGQSFGSRSKGSVFPCLDRKVGGRSGGGSQITARAKNLMKHYEGFRKMWKKAMRKSYRRHFGYLEEGVSI